MIGSDFVRRTHVGTMVYCSECHRKIRAGMFEMVSIRGGVVRKRVCSDECRLIFDDHYWQAVARERKDK